jgi:hypothetical protein
VRLDHLVLMVLLEIQVQLDGLALPDQLELGKLVQLERPVLMGQQDQLGMDQQVRQVLKVHIVEQVFLDLDLLVLKQQHRTRWEFQMQ